MFWAQQNLGGYCPRLSPRGYGPETTPSLQKLTRSHLRTNQCENELCITDTWVVVGRRVVIVRSVAQVLTASNSQVHEVLLKRCTVADGRQRQNTAGVGLVREWRHRVLCFIQESFHVIAAGWKDKESVKEITRRDETMTTKVKRAAKGQVSFIYLLEARFECTVQPGF